MVTGVCELTASGATPQARQDSLNAVTEGGSLQFNPRVGYGASADLTVRVISTENQNANQIAPDSAGGADGTAKTETVSDQISICVHPFANLPSFDVKVGAIKGNAMATEDACNPISIEVTLNDPDRSETYVLEIANDLPSVEIDGITYPTRLYGASDTAGDCTGPALEPLSGGVYVLQSADVEQLKLVLPLHWSSPVQGYILSCMRRPSSTMVRRVVSART